MQQPPEAHLEAELQASRDIVFPTPRHHDREVFRNEEDHDVDEEREAYDEDEECDEIVIDTASRIRTATSSPVRRPPQSTFGIATLTTAAVATNQGDWDPHGDHSQRSHGNSYRTSFHGQQEEDDNGQEADPVFVGKKSHDEMEGSSSSRPKKRRRAGLYLLVGLVVLIVVATSVGVSVSRNRSIPSPTSSNSTSSEDGASTPDPCPTELADMQGCFDDPEAASLCEQCVVQFWPETVNSCDDIDDETCTGFDNCPSCSPCRGHVLTYVSCLSECDIGCPYNDDPDNFPDSDACADQYAAFDACVDPQKGGAACEDCVSSSWPPPPVNLTCQDIANYTCPGLARKDNCQCNGCDYETLDLLKCLGNCTALECQGESGIGVEASGETDSAGQERWSRAMLTRRLARTVLQAREQQVVDHPYPATFAGHFLD